MIDFMTLSTWNKCLLKYSISLIAHSTKKGPNAVFMFSEDTDFAPIFYRQIFFSYRVRTRWKLLGTLWLLIPWNTFSGFNILMDMPWKVQKIYFHSLKYLFISSNLIAKRGKILNLASVYHVYRRLENKQTYTYAF